MGWFVARKVRNSAPPQFAGGEPVVLEAPANHFRKIEAVGGNLYLTDRRLVFKPHQINAQRRELSIPLSDIAELRPVPTMWVVPNGLLVTTRNGGSERFVVENREGWIGKIEETTSHTLRL
jgi:hypothetical protein